MAKWPAQCEYDPEYKAQAVKLAQELGSVVKEASELGMSVQTLYGTAAVRQGRLDIGPGAHEPRTALTLTKELIKLRAQKKALEENAFLEEASAFFAASRRKSSKTPE